MEAIKNRLCEAAITGNVESLHEILQHDDLILNKFAVPCFGWTPLHVAVSLGHANFVTELLHLQPKLAQVLDSAGRSALHLATAAQVSNSASQSQVAAATQVLVDVAPNMCMTRDKEGQNPVHIAAIKGKVDMLEQLLQACPEAAFARVDREETILHLCVKYNQRQALEKLLNLIKDQEFFNAVDADGQNILQLAVSRGREEIEALLREKMKRKLWAFQPLQLGLNRSSNEGIMLAASIMATVAFQVVVNPPGGVWQNDSLTYRAGESIMAYHYPVTYSMFLGAATFGFIAAYAVMFLAMSGVPPRSKTIWRCLSLSMWLALMCMGVTFSISFSWLTPRNYKKEIVLSEAAIVFILFQCILIFMGHRHQ